MQGETLPNVWQSLGTWPCSGAPSKPRFEKPRKKNKKRAQWIILVGLRFSHHLHPQFFKSWFCFGVFFVIDDAFFSLASSKKIHVLYNKGCLYLENDYLAGNTSLKVMEVLSFHKPHVSIIFYIFYLIKLLMKNVLFFWENEIQNTFWRGGYIIHFQEERASYVFVLMKWWQWI